MARLGKGRIVFNTKLFSKVFVRLSLGRIVFNINLPKI